MRKTNIGGQALIEGVMMKGTGVVAMAVRDERGNIRMETARTGDRRRWWSYVPVLRGVVAFFDAMINGTRMLLKSSEVFIEENENKTATDKKEKGTGWFIFFTLLISIALAVGLFFLLPNLLTDLIVNVFGWGLSPFVKNLIDGVLRLAIFLIYMVAVTRVTAMSTNCRLRWKTCRSRRAYTTDAALRLCFWSCSYLCWCFPSWGGATTRF